MPVAFTPVKLQAAGMQRMIGQYQPCALFFSEPALNQGKIQIWITAVNFVAHDRMAKVREVNTDLMFAPGAGNDPQQGEVLAIADKSLFDPKFGLRRRAVRADAIFDGDHAGFILAQWRINHPLLRRDMAVNDGKIFLLHRTSFPDFSQFTRRLLTFGDDHQAGRFTIKTIDQTRLKFCL